MSKIISVDAETNGLYGSPFAVAMVVMVDGGIVDDFVFRVPIVGPVNEFVEGNVLPALSDMPVSHASLDEGLKDLWDFYMYHKKDTCDIIAHVAHPVETGLFRRLIETDLENRMWDGPFPLHDAATALRVEGHNPTSVDDYIKKEGIQIPSPYNELAVHHPLYDAVAAALVWYQLLLSS